MKSMPVLRTWKTSFHKTNAWCGRRYCWLVLKYCPRLSSSFYGLQEFIESASVLDESENERILASFCKRITSENSPKSKHERGGEAIILKGFQSILRACRVKATLSQADGRGKKTLIKSNQPLSYTIHHRRNWLPFSFDVHCLTQCNSDSLNRW